MSFYVPEGEAFHSTEWTRGPWDEGSQHAGPPAALVGRAIETCEPRDDARIVRITFEILRPVPIAPVRVDARVVRGGKRIELIDATLRGESDEPLMMARAWRMRSTDVELPIKDEETPLPGPESGSFSGFSEHLQVDRRGWHAATEWSFLNGGFTEHGPACGWARSTQPLVAGEEPSPLQRVLIIADAGNGISCILDPSQFLFLNVDLTVELFRVPDGEWVNLDSRTTVDRSGAGLTETTLRDRTGRIGSATQTLFVDAR